MDELLTLGAFFGGIFSFVVFRLAFGGENSSSNIFRDLEGGKLDAKLVLALGRIGALGRRPCDCPRELLPFTTAS